MKMFGRIALWALASVVIIVLVLGDAELARGWKFNPPPPAWDYPKPANALEAQRQDLAHFRKLIAMDRSFSAEARTEAERRIAALEKSDQVLPKPQFRVALMRIVALADNGHTSLRSDPGAYPMILPVRVAQFSDGIYVMHAAGEGVDLLGGRITAIDGKPIDEVLAKLAQLRGGAENMRRLTAALYIMVQDILVGAGIAPDMKHSTWTVIAPNGETLTRTLSPRVLDDKEPGPLEARWMSSEPAKGMPVGWRAFQPDKLAVTLQQFDKTFRRMRLPNSCVMLVQMKSNQDVDDEHIADFIAVTEEEMRKAPPCNLIMDMRYNGGGDYTNTAGFAGDLPKLIAPEGRIYVLTGPATFSAAITTTGFLKQAGGERVMIVGEPVGDRLVFWSEGERGCLPNYHLCVNYQTGKHDYAHPCTNWDECYWVNWIYPVRVKTLQPDETVTMSFADWRQGRDPVLERAVALASK